MYLWGMGNISPSFSWSRSSSCLEYFFLDDTCLYNAETCVSGYNAPNYTKEDITSTTITLSDDAGNSWVYSDYLPTQGTITLTYESFTQTIVVEPTLTDTGCGCVQTEAQVVNFADGCYSVDYSLFVDGVLVGNTSDSFFFYCVTRNRVYDLIEGQCNDCCDAQRQAEIYKAKQNYDVMLISYNKAGCSCAEGLLAQLQKQLDKLEGNC